MAATIRARLAQLVDEYGVSLYEDPRRCKSLLLDAIGNSRDASVLSAAVSAGIINDLKSLDSGLPFEVHARAFAKRLYDESGLSEDLALWSIQSWALALGVIASDDLVAEMDRTLDSDAGSKGATADAEYQFCLGEAITEKAFLDAEKLAEAEKHIREAVSIDPENAKYQLALGSCVVSQEVISGNSGAGRRHDEAVACLRFAERYYRDAVTREPDNADYAHKLADSLECQGKKFEAEQFYRSAVTSEPDNPIYLRDLAGTLGDQGKTDEAERFLTKAVDLDPADFKSRALIGAIFFNREDFARSLPYLQNAVRLEPTIAPLQLLLGSCLNAMDRYTEAEAHLRKALELDQDSAQAHFSLSVALVAQEKFEDAEYHVGQAVRLDPANADICDFANKLKTRSSASNGGGDCFVATACFGTVHAPEVRLLRMYRDVVLVRSRMGRAFIRWYYAFGPQLADSIRYRPKLKSVVRNLLIRPLALVAGLFLRMR